MTTSTLNRVIQHLRSAELANLTDGQLLGRFIDRKDEAAFETLVRRHGPMVLGVCRRILGSPHDADDAFQVTFLVLVRKAASIMPRQMVANWLHGVACQTAVRVKTANAKRRAKEAPMTTAMPEPQAVENHDSWNDLHRLLDQELSKLPEKYRLPVILCDLEGKSIKEATRQIGCPQGTLAGRLARARTMLAKRLTRRGLVLPAGVLAALLSQQVASASVPSSLMMSTVKAGTLLAAGKPLTTGVVSASVASLTEGMAKSMLLTKLKTITAVVLVSIGCLGLGVATYPVFADAQVATGDESTDWEVDLKIPQKHLNPKQASKPKKAPNLTEISETEVVVRLGKLYRLQMSNKKPITTVTNDKKNMVIVTPDPDSPDGSTVVLTPNAGGTAHIALGSDAGREYFRVIVTDPLANGDKEIGPGKRVVTIKVSGVEMLLSIEKALIQSKPQAKNLEELLFREYVDVVLTVPGKGGNTFSYTVAENVLILAYDRGRPTSLKASLEVTAEQSIRLIQAQDKTGTLHLIVRTPKQQQPPKDAPVKKTTQVDVPSRLDGNVTFIGVVKRHHNRLRVGDTVEVGDLLARLDDELVYSDEAVKEAKVAECMADLAAAQKALAEAEASHRKVGARVRNRQTSTENRA